MMNPREARRLGLVEGALQGRVTNREGAERLGVSERQFRRLKQRVRQAGAAALVHGNRGRPSPRRLGAAVHREVIVLLTESPVRVNDCHVSDLLAERGLTVSPATVRRIRGTLRLAPKQRRRPPRHHRRRERRAREGAMVLIDGSPFRWLGPSGEVRTLIGMHDDACGRMLALTLRPAEDLHGYATVLQQTLATHGVPETLYGDGTSIAVRSDRHWSRAEELSGRQDPTHFGAMLEALGIGYIRARSPQAKGRIERLWRTVQDRLTAELALAGITRWESAEAFLPGFIERFNRQFAVAPRDAAPAWRRPPRALDRTLACRYRRVVGRDNVVRFFGSTLQLPPGAHRRSHHGRHVEVRELLDGRLLVLDQGRVLLEQAAPHRPFDLVPRESDRAHPPARGDRSQTLALHGRPERARPQPQLRRDRRGQITNVRPPAPNHPWKGRRPQPPTPPPRS